MFQNYLKIAWRNLLRHKAFSFINILGLALGMTCSILIALWVQDELSYNTFHKNGPQLYRIMANLNWGEIQTGTNTPQPLAEALRKDIPEITHVVQLTEWDLGVIFKANGKTNKETKGRFASPELFQMFSFPLVEGDPKTALVAPDAVVISQSLARRYFGNRAALGQIITIKGQNNVRVTGVMQNISKNSSLQFDFVLPMQGFVKKNDWVKTWGNFSLTTFLQLRPDADFAKVDAQVRKYMPQNHPEQKADFFLQPVSAIHLYAYKASKPDGGRIVYVRLFTLVAVFILLIACINFMNLATARSSKRSKEVGIRKVIGAARSLLVGQFMGEALLTASLAVLFSLVLVILLLPAFNQLTGKTITIAYSSPLFFLSLMGITVVTGLIAGSYPALFLSAMEPVKVLKGAVAGTRRGAFLRKGLVVFQFTLSLILMVGTVVIYRQINFIQNTNLGFDRENVIAIGIEGDLDKNIKVFKTEILQTPGIKRATITSDLPLAIYNSSADLQWPGKAEKEAASISGVFVDYDYLQTMNIRIKEGRAFSRDFASDSDAYMINEAAADMMGMRNPVGQTVSFWNGKGKIIGVTKNFHSQSLHEPIKPLIMLPLPEPRGEGVLLVRTEPGKTKEAVASLEKAIRKYNPGYPFDYKFLDKVFEEQYRSEMTVGTLINCFAGLAIFISCLGLFGLALFTAEQRTKEIGVRKVLGASVVNIVALLSKDFLKLVLLANVLAWPLAWWAMNKWLQNFAFRADLGWWIFALAGIATLCIALITVSFQAVRSAVANPVNALRSE
ncbi:ABC transporter permease [Adhaeribacter pallidiroseus]|uniref:Macrolide export ATP-binding/permease protein MacB n=1 Tax=Adhaeribacter pallidiroseus TaxID=2072847 RepID=A0A369QKM4_9BACT|nr:ABC transporter permease [Adhaeribacter pallidiroseus]RDC65451.1 Macrolide export ATP-binding/permease protein MacB [Adhaeribacter pallidiroseus]